MYPVKIEFKEYPSGNWEDWSQYLLEAPSIVLQVESDNPGEAGVLVFDNCKLSFYYQQGNPVYDRFSIDLSSVQRYLFRISILNSNNTYVKKFEGLADFSTIKWNEYENIISFEVVDKISALGILTSEECRTQYKIKSRLLNSVPLARGFEFQYHNGQPNVIWISAFHPDVYDDLTQRLVYPGEVIDIPEIVSGQSKLRVITKSVLSASPLHGKVANYVEFVPYLDQTDFDVIQYQDPDTYPDTENDWTLHKAYNKELYGVDVGIYEDGILTKLDGIEIIEVLYNQAWSNTTLIRRPSNLEFYVPAEYAVRMTDANPFGKNALDALITLVNSIDIGNGSGCYLYVDVNDNLVLQSRYSLTIGTQRSLGNTKIFNFVRKYFWDKLCDGAKVILHTWQIDQSTGKYIDVEASLTSKPSGLAGFIKPRNEIKKELISSESPPTGEDPKIFYTQKAYEYCQNILNFYGNRHESIEYTLKLDDNTINWSILDYLTKGSIDYFITRLVIDTGERLIDIETVSAAGYDYDLRQVLIPWSESSYSYSGQSSVITGTYTNSEIDYLAPLELFVNQLKLNYNTTNLKLTSNALDTIQDISTTSTPTFVQLVLSNAGTNTNQAVRADRLVNTNYPLTGGGNLTADRTIGLNYNSTNLKITGNALNTIQDIATTSTPTFAQLVLSNAGTNTNQAVRADRLVNTNYPLTGGGNLTADRTIGLSYNTTNLKLTSNALNTIQDISTTSTPTFNQLILNNAGTTTSNAVRADRIINTTAPLTGGGDLTSDRTLGLNYNTINLKLTSNALNTIQDIATTSSPTFATVKLTNLTNGYIPYHINDLTGFADSIIFTDGTNVGVGATSLSYKLDVSGTGRFTSNLRVEGIIKQIGTSGFNEFNASTSHNGNSIAIYSDNFLSGWTGSGWRIDRDITASGRTHFELDDLTVRGTMRVYELIINQIRATNGSLFVSSSAKALSVTRQTSDPVIYTIVFEDPEGHGVCPFLVNDILICQRVRLDSITFVKQIVLKVTDVSGTQITGVVLYENGEITKNDLLVRIGNTTNTARQGALYLTSDDSNAPYMDITDGVNSWSAWSSQNKVKIRLGRLSGITDNFFGTLSSYGLYAKGSIWLTNQDQTTHRVTLRTDINPGLLVAVNTGGANPLYLSVGRIYLNTTSGYTNNYGLALKSETGSDYFELSNNVLHIAGWNFDAQKFYKGTDIELNSSTKSIGVNSNKVKMFYTNSSNWGIEGRDNSNNLVFQLGSTNKIAGWTIISESIYKLQSGTPFSSPSYGLTINATSSASTIIAYGSNSARYVKLGYQTSGNWYGIEGTDINGSIVFQLGSSNMIAGWFFTNNKFYNGIVSLESSTSMKGLVVDIDRIKIGAFTYDTMSNSYSEINDIVIGYPNIDPNDTFWGIMGNYWVNNEPYTPSLNLSNLYANTSILNEVHYWDYRLTHRLFLAESYLLGRKVRHRVIVYFTLGNEGLAYSGGLFQIAIRYYNEDWETIYRQVIYQETIADNLSGTYTIDLSSGIEFTLPANIPNFYAAYIEYCFSGGGQTGTYYPYDMDIAELYINAYLDCKTWINEKGLYIYNSDSNYIKLYENQFEINIPILKVRDKNVMRFHGILASAPTEDVELGDVFIRSSDKKVFICNDINNLGEPQWTQLN